MSDFRFNQRPKEDPSKKSCGQRWDWAPRGGVVRYPNFFSSNSPRQILPWNVTIHSNYQYQKVKLCESHICLQTKLRVECTNEMFMCIQLHRTSHLNILTKMQSCQRVCQAQIKISIKCYSFMIQNDAIATVLFGRARVIIFSPLQRIQNSTFKIELCAR